MGSLSLLSWLATTTIVLAIWILYGAIWRLFLSPIAGIPGPKLAALTFWYEFYYDAMLPGKYVFKIAELHKVYGPILRISPTEIHVDDPGFLDTVYAPSLVRRDKHEYQLRTFRIPTAVGTTADYHLHRKRREALVPFFSKKNVLHLEPMVNEKVNQLIEVLEHHAKVPTVVNVSNVFFAFANDVACNFLFAHRMDLLSDLEKAAMLRRNGNSLLLGIKINQHFPWLIDFIESLPSFLSRPMMPPGLVDMIENTARVRAELLHIMAENEDLPDVNDYQSKGSRKKSVIHTLLSSKVLPSSEKELSRLEQEGSLLLTAGTESPAKTLNVILFHLLSNPQILRKLQDELAPLPQDANWSQLDKLPYLSAVIEEGNRLSFGVTARLARIAPEALYYVPSPLSSSTATKSTIIPAGAPVSVTTLSVHTNEKLFPNPYKFHPDRWLGSNGAELRKYQMAFNKGGRKCLGIELAYAELYLALGAIARLLLDYDMELFETTADDVAFHHDYQVAMPQLGSKGVRAKIVRKR